MKSHDTEIHFAYMKNQFYLGLKFMTFILPKTCFVNAYLLQLRQKKLLLSVIPKTKSGD